MTSRGPGKQVRKSAAERRREIVAAAAQVGLEEGLECVTRQRIADGLGVQTGLIHHYFPVIEELVAEAFTSATTAELDGLLPEAEADSEGHGALSTLQRFFTRISGAEFDNISKLWLNARHLSRYRPVLHDQVVGQELRWCRRIEQIITQGVKEQTFQCEDPWAAAVRILAIVDGVSTYINTSAGQRMEPLTDLARTLAEAELGLPAGGLHMP
ncbi:DNA-binding transcriptional regulator YbjK [Streptomyces sp. DSM 42143]|uniref:TetR/AcrR family transcriptional regulator n=1 Tax=Streptomyces TaxID=1883 RepID=UPI000BD387A5|nr:MULTISPECIES: TetR family transcriptional regulator C-terminal domain-containing protein [unclassified Streptomyces]MDN3247614.1 TetR family transcriptional regulator C-terminal domain-containing protein [Streptomyces sp. ZSW22]MDN3254056.1 TetR family transcriptional regulator C-terminal domain-containing protein [Streptomyces sp. MA25(2023)]MDQ0383280.1 DNA-binding transcriptional regulator YbjK [Streptomyces sp. DSM 42143]PAK26389.1 TetR family transcriptional regulator [Streptomyces sp. 